MKAFQYDSFTFPLPEDHRFPVQNTWLIRNCRGGTPDLGV